MLYNKCDWIHDVVIVQIYIRVLTYDTLKFIYPHIRSFWLMNFVIVFETDKSYQLNNDNCEY